MTEEERKEEGQAAPADAAAPSAPAVASSEAAGEETLSRVELPAEVPSGPPPAPSLRQSLLVYKDWRMAKILLIGSMSGFPWILIASMMSLWLKSEGLSRSGIGFFGIVFTVYAFNMWWAPIVDSVKLPFLSRFGQRRSWIL
ncbi:MAG: hypothetical protein ISN26_00325, partial [Betaproteobacteria bacterium AqS2]|nr:hypothetical protein [Betaproteobacteria bacterium AqS2]